MLKLSPSHSSTWLTKSLSLLLPLLNRNLLPQRLNFKYNTFDRLRILILHNGQLYRKWRFMLPSHQNFPSTSECNIVGDATTVGGRLAYTITFCRPMTIVTTIQTSWHTIDGGNVMTICLSFGTICKVSIL